MVRAFNTLKRELKRQQDQLLMDHQEESTVSGGNASTFQFPYLLVADTTPMSATTTVPTAATFDANEGATGTASTFFETRRDFYQPRTRFLDV